MEINYEDCYLGFHKKPLMPSPKFGYLGVRIQSPDRSHILCNECGNFYKRIHTKHLQKHGLSMMEYREKHGYSKNTAMIADMESLNISRAILGKAHAINNNPKLLEKAKESRELSSSSWKNSNERQNKYGTCHEQIRDRLKNYIERFGQLPSYNAMGEDRKALFSLLKHRYGDVNKGFKEYGLPTKKLYHGFCVEYTFSDGEKIQIGYKFDNWEKLIEKVKSTSYLFNQ